MTTILVRDQLRFEVEGSSDGQITVLYDKKGYPNYMMVIPKFRSEEASPEFGKGVCPAFVVNGIEKSEIFIGLNLAVVKGGCGISIPGVEPTTRVNFDQALLYCKKKGPGWHLTSNAEWAALAMWCAKNGWLYKDLRSGMQGLFSSRWEWVGGLRLNGGEIQVLPNNDAADNTKDQGAESELWKSISSKGDLVAPGEDGAFAYHADGNNGVWLAAGKPAEKEFGYCRFRSLQAGDGIEVPDILKQLLLFPANLDGAMNVSGGFWAYADGESLPIRGGYWHYGANAGLFALNLSSLRSSTSSNIGFRPAYVPEKSAV
jgi:hypothetical protein